MSDAATTVNFRDAVHILASVEEMAPERTCEFVHGLFFSPAKYFLPYVFDALCQDEKRLPHVARAVQEGARSYLYFAASTLSGDYDFDHRTNEMLRDCMHLNDSVATHPKLQLAMIEGVKEAFDLVIQFIMSGQPVLGLSKNQPKTPMNMTRFFHLVTALMPDPILSQGITLDRVSRLGWALTQRDVSFIGFAGQVKNHPYLIQAVKPSMFDRAHAIYTSNGWHGPARVISGIKQTFAFSAVAGRAVQADIMLDEGVAMAPKCGLRV